MSGIAIHSHANQEPSSLLSQCLIYHCVHSHIPVTFFPSLSIPSILVYLSLSFIPGHFSVTTLLLSFLPLQISRVNCGKSNLLSSHTGSCHHLVKNTPMAFHCTEDRDENLECGHGRSAPSPTGLSRYTCGFCCCYSLREFSYLTFFSHEHSNCLVNSWSSSNTSSIISSVGNLSSHPD